MDFPDKYTVVMKSNAPWPGIFTFLAIFNVIDPQTMQQPDGVQHPVGTGPFTFVEYAQGDHITLKRNPNYWQTGKPYVDQLQIQLLHDPQALVTQLEAGAMDVAVGAPLVDAVRLQNDPKYRVLQNKTTGTRLTIINNTQQPPQDNKQFRQALAYSIDKQRILDTVLHGFGQVASLPFTPSSPAYDATRATPSTHLTSTKPGT
jgi:peptide/nickel transport system substrate-binding protein